VNTKDKIIQESTKAFNKNGFGAVSLHEIANILGIMPLHQGRYNHLVLIPIQNLWRNDSLKSSRLIYWSD